MRVPTCSACFLHLLHQPGALDDVRETGIILDVGGDGELAARLHALDDDRSEAGAGRIDGGSEARRARSEDQHAGGMGRGHRALLLSWLVVSRWR
jgi:hypothetical protein